LHMFVARCKNWCKKRRYQIVTTILLLALIIPAPGILTEYARRGRELKALEAENDGLRGVVNGLLGLSDKYADLMDVSDALGLDYEDAVNALRAENPNVKIPELTIFALLDRSTYFADWISAEIETDREKLGGYILAAESTPNHWPVLGRITSEFGNRYISRGSKLAQLIGRIGIDWHGGVDIGASTGARVEATAAGTVTFTGERDSYGNLVIVDHGVYQTYYAHLQRVTVSVGDKLSRGDRVGTVGSTGTSTGPHLHYEVRVQGEAVNPRRYLP
jgi:murein DD-endopeptidase MepM/ murein hydrolase activator NlpD